jgi:adenosylcobinamide-GDP ribazoletransferase
MAAVGAISRAACLAPLALLPPARADGAGQAAAFFSTEEARAASLLALALAFLPWLAGASLTACLSAALFAALAVWGLCALARAQIGGQTGDVAGAAQQVAEIAALLVFAGAAG